MPKASTNSAMDAHPCHCSWRAPAPHRANDQTPRSLPPLNGRGIVGNPGNPAAGAHYSACHTMLPPLHHDHGHAHTCTHTDHWTAHALALV